MRKFIVNSNIFLFVPVIAAFLVEEWVYCLIAFSASITSPLYHYIVELHPEKLSLHKLTQRLDWFVAICAYTYMFYYIFAKVKMPLQIPLAIALSATIIFFWYGFKIRGYKKLHPWFHIGTSIVSAIIVLSK